MTYLDLVETKMRTLIFLAGRQELHHVSFSAAAHESSCLAFIRFAAPESTSNFKRILSRKMWSAFLYMLDAMIKQIDSSYWTPSMPSSEWGVEPDSCSYQSFIRCISGGVLSFVKTCQSWKRCSTFIHWSDTKIRTVIHLAGNRWYHQMVFSAASRVFSCLCFIRFSARGSRANLIRFQSREICSTFFDLVSKKMKTIDPS